MKNSHASIFLVLTKCIWQLYLTTKYFYFFKKRYNKKIKRVEKSINFLCKKSTRYLHVRLWTEKPLYYKKFKKGWRKGIAKDFFFKWKSLKQIFLQNLYINKQQGKFCTALNRPTFSSSSVLKSKDFVAKQFETFSYLQKKISTILLPPPTK